MNIPTPNFKPLGTKHGTQFIDGSGNIWTAKWDKDNGASSYRLTLRSDTSFGENILYLGDFRHAFDSLGMVKI